MTVSLLAGCGTKSSSDSTESSTTQEEETSDDFLEETAIEEEGQSEEDADDSEIADEIVSEEADALLDTSEELSGLHHVEIEIQDYGTISVELDADSAPITVTNFIKLCQEDFYDGLTFHRIMDGFMMQGGDPLGNGTGGSKETIKGEFSSNGVENNLSHTRGAISMARATAPDSASSQFFIVQTDSHFLDGNYAVFGYVTDGMDIVDEICENAEPTDDNGTIPADEQPVIVDIKVID
jgi:peptidyl-prolyl cis-trans isomerase B (cyclophilin B)